ncbi:MAG: hypothetical protein HY726_23365 [Candidatus Rokubacteria bacterium]|nr:hypothetical protein [Candidatus Rokubacteria bacterium]
MAKIARDPKAECRLGEVICTQGPWKEMCLEKDWEDQIQKDETRYLQWYFRGANHQVGKAFRIPVDVIDEHGHKYKEHILIGYEGAGY